VITTAISGGSFGDTPSGMTTRTSKVSRTSHRVVPFVRLLARGFAGFADLPHDADIDAVAGMSSAGKCEVPSVAALLGLVAFGGPSFVLFVL